MKVVWVGLGLGVALALQTTLAPMVAGAEVPVDLVLVVVIAVAVARGPLAGLWAGTVGGLVQDTLSGGVVGVGALAKTLVGYLVGQFGLQFLVTRSWHQVLTYFLASLVHSGVFVGIYRLLPSDAVTISYLDILNQAAVNAAVGLALALTVRMVPQALARRRKRRRSVMRFGG